MKALPNRAARRRHVKQAGGSWRREREAKKRADRVERLALEMQPAEAREALARWAAKPGRSQAEVDALNARAGGVDVCQRP